MARKKATGAKARPLVARDAKMVEYSGAMQNWDRESPMPASGPMRAILRPRTSS